MNPVELRLKTLPMLDAMNGDRSERAILKSQIAEAIAEIESLRSELAEAKVIIKEYCDSLPAPAFIDAMPKSANGVVIEIGKTELWWLSPSRVHDSTSVSALGICMGIRMGPDKLRCFVTCGHSCREYLLSNCYSSYETAEKARRERG